MGFNHPLLGSTGPQGSTGTQGAQGPQGPVGKSVPNTFNTTFVSTEGKTVTIQNGLIVGCGAPL
jgi:hypothetical protein